MRFIEPGAPLYLESLLDEILVICPRCQALAHITPTEHTDFLLFSPRRLLCAKCGLAKNWAGRGLSYLWHSSSPREPYFDLPLWLQAFCSGKSLWFVNLQHLQIVEQYVRADLREKQRHPHHGWSNQNLFNRLPKFIKEAKHRKEVLHAIEKLKQKL